MALTKDDLLAIRAVVRDEVQEQIEPMQKDIARLNQSVEPMQKDIARLNQSVTKLEQLPHQIQLIAEAQQHTNEKLDTLQKTVDEMAGTVAALDIMHQIQPHS